MYASTWNGKKKNSRFFPGTTSNPPTPNDDASDNTSKPISFFKRHTYFRNFLIATFVLSTIMTITTTIVIKQVVPGTVQSAIDSSTITFGQTNVTNAAQDASTFDLYSEITVTCDAPLAVVIQDVRLTFTYDDLIVGYATLPAIKLNKGDKEKVGFQCAPHSTYPHTQPTTTHKRYQTNPIQSIPLRQLPPPPPLPSTTPPLQGGTTSPMT